MVKDLHSQNVTYSLYPGNGKVSTLWNFVCVAILLNPKRKFGASSNSQAGGTSSKGVFGHFSLKYIKMSTFRWKGDAGASTNAYTCKQGCIHCTSSKIIKILNSCERISSDLKGSIEKKMTPQNVTKMSTKFQRTIFLHASIRIYIFVIHSTETRYNVHKLKQRWIQKFGSWVPGSSSNRDRPPLWTDAR